MTVFVNPTAASNGAGTVLDPKNTWNSMDWSSDDDFAQCAGTVFETTGANGLAPNVTGTATARKRIRSYEPGTGSPTREKATIAGATRYGINLSANVGFYDIEDLAVTEIGDGTNANNGITASVSPADDAYEMQIAIRRCHIYELRPGAADTNGINLRGAGNLVEDCWIWSVPTDGISGRGIRLNIRRTRIEQINTDGRNQADCIHLSTGTGALVIEDCYLDGSAGTGKQCIIVNASSGTDARIIRRNMLIGGAGAQQGIYTDTTTLIYGNTIVDCIFGVRSLGASRVMGNLFINRRSAGQHYGIWLEGNNQVAANNTMLNFVAGQPDTQRAIYCEGGHAGHTLTNNLIHGYTVGIRLAENAGQVESRNWFSDVATPVLGIVANPMLGSGSQIADAMEYIHENGLLRVPYLLGGVPMRNPMGGMGTYVQGVRLMGGRRLDPGRVPIGAYGEGRY